MNTPETIARLRQKCRMLFRVGVMACAGSVVAQDGGDAGAVDADLEIQNAGNGKFWDASLAEVVSWGLVHNLELIAAGIDPQIAEQEVRRELAAFEPYFESSINQSFERRPLNAEELASTGLPGTAGRSYSDRRTLYEAGIGGRLAYGTEWDLSYRGNRFRNDINTTSETALFTPEYGTFFGLTITQPLLRGAGKDANLAPARLARAEEKIASLEYSRKAEDLALELSARYYDLASAYQETAVRAEAVRLARVLTGESRTRERTGAGTLSEVIEAESTAAFRYDEYQISVTRLIESQTALLASLGGYGQSGELFLPRPTDTAPVLEKTGPREELILIAMEKRLDFKRAKLEIEKQDIQLQYARNQRYPQLDLSATYGVLGLADSAGSSASRAASPDNPTWGVGLTLRIPWGGAEADALEKSADLRKLQAIQGLKRVEEEILLGVDSQLRIIEIHERRVDSAKEAIALARRRLENESLKLSRGTGTGFAVLEAQKYLTDTMSQEIRAMSDYRRGISKLAHVKGTLLSELGLELK